MVEVMAEFGLSLKDFRSTGMATHIVWSEEARAAILLYWLVPRQTAAPVDLIQEFRILRRTRVLLVLAMSALGSASLFCVFTYITPTLEGVTGLSPHAVTLVLLLFGVGITIGNLLGGRLSDWRQMTAILSMLTAVIVLLVLLYFAEPFAIPTVALVLLWGLAQFAAGSPLQARIVEQASNAPNLASTLNQGAFNLGNAAGASLGGALLTAGFSYRALPWASICTVLLSLTLAIWSARLEARHVLVANTQEQSVS